jgi:hypothetical protein
VRLAGSIFLALGCAAAIPAHADYCDNWQRGQRVDLNCIPEMDLLTEAELQLTHAPSVHDVLSHPESPSVRAYVAAVKDQLFVNSETKTTDGVTWRIYTFGSVPGKACLPLNVPVTFDTLVGPVRDYPRAHPGAADLGYDKLSFLTVLPIALYRAYPCPSSLR